VIEPTTCANDCDCYQTRVCNLDHFSCEAKESDSRKRFFKKAGPEDDAKT